jgi:quaternary ammonium compound-resistance protein SugE
MQKLDSDTRMIATGAYALSRAPRFAALLHHILYLCVLCALCVRSSFFLRTREDTMAWLILTVAGLLEVVWAIGLKYTQGFTRLVPTLITVIAMLGSVAMLGLAMRTLPVGTAYAVWTGIGAVGTVILGIVLFQDSIAPMRIASVALIFVGIIGLKFST